MAPCAQGGAPAAALAAAQAAELAARLRARAADPLSTGSGLDSRRPSGELRGGLPNPPGTRNDGRLEELDTSPAPLPRLGGGKSGEGARLNGFHGPGHPGLAGPGSGRSWQGQNHVDKLSGSWSLEPTTIGSLPPAPTALQAGQAPVPIAQALPEVPAQAPLPEGPAGPAGPAGASGLGLPGSSRLEVPSDAGTEGRQASVLPPPPSVFSSRLGSVPASRRGRSRPTSPMRSEYHWLEAAPALPPVPPAALWFASAEELDRRSRSAERSAYVGSQSQLAGLSYAAVWPPPPLPPVSEDLRQRLEKLEARRLAEQDTLARTVEELTLELRSRDNHQQVQTLEGQVESLRLAEKALQAELSSSRAHEEEAKKQLQRVEADRVRLETLIVTVEQQCSDLREELHDAKGRSGDWHRLHESVKDLESERDRLRRSYSDSERLRVEAHAESDALREELREFKEFKQRAIKAEHQLRSLQEQLEDRSASEGRQLQAERQQVRSLTQENQRLKRSLHDSEAAVSTLRAQKEELEKDQRAWQKAEKASQKSAAALRQEVEKLRRERHMLDAQAESQERRSRHSTRHSTVQARPPDSGSSAHRSTVMEVDLREEGKPHMEEKEVDDSDSQGSSDDYYDQEPPEHIKQRLAGLRAR